MKMFCEPLVVQWLIICLPIAGDTLLVQEMPHVMSNKARVKQLLSPHGLKPASQENPLQGEACSPQLESSPTCPN